MATIKNIIKQTDNNYLDLYKVNAVSGKGAEVHDDVASRSRSIEGLKMKSGKDFADGVAVFALYGDKRDKVVLVKQYRYTIGGFVYEMPAGLCEKREDFHETAIREMKEETGLDFTPINAGHMYEKPAFTSIGFSDEAVATVFGYADGEISEEFQEMSEEIQVVIADRAEVKRILREERVSMQCSYQLMHFIADEDVFGFLKSGA